MTAAVQSPAQLKGRTMTFAQKLQHFLEQRQWSVNELARQSGVPYTTLKAYFQRKKTDRPRLPTYASVVAICKALDVPTDSFKDCSDWGN